jgi:oligopeptide/dipeptide ABC transporter ATP-binding protein
MTEHILDIHHLSVRLGPADILDGVSFSVPRGGSVGLLGETGSGKSMTCRALLGLGHRVGARVTAGQIWFRGQDLAQLSERDWARIRGRQIALVPQASLNSLNPLRRVGAQISETVRALDHQSSPSQRTVELLEQVDMPRPRDTARMFPHELSGGMRQRAAIALALAGRPALLVADEPTTALDVTVQHRILKLLDSLRRDTGMSMILVSHDLSVLRQACERVAVIYAGQVIEQGPMDTVFEHPAHPYTRALRAARPDPSAPRTRLAAIPGAPPTPLSRPRGCAFAPRCRYAYEACTEAVPPMHQLPADHSAACVRLDELAPL